MIEESRYGTSLMETEALMAVMSDNTESAEEILAEMLSGELYMLASHAENLSEMAMDEWRRRQAATTTRSHPSGGDV